MVTRCMTGRNIGMGVGGLLTRYQRLLSATSIVRVLSRENNADRLEIRAQDDQLCFRVQGAKEAMGVDGGYSWGWGRMSRRAFSLEHSKSPAAGSQPRPSSIAHQPQTMEKAQTYRFTILACLLRKRNESGQRSGSMVVGECANKIAHRST